MDTIKTQGTWWYAVRGGRVLALFPDPGSAYDYAKESRAAGEAYCAVPHNCLAWSNDECYGANGPDSSGILPTEKQMAGLLQRPEVAAWFCRKPGRDAKAANRILSDLRSAIAPKEARHDQ